MTQSKRLQWRKCTDPEKLLKLLEGKASERKLWLFVCACLYRSPDCSHLLPAIAMTERFVDGDACREEFATAWEEGWGTPVNDTNLNALKLAEGTIFRDYFEDVGQYEILRDIFGNPFRSVSINPTWLTPTVLALAQAAYEERILPSGTLDNSRLAVLGDSLEDAGSTNQDILNHLREPSVHVRGCHVVDLLLGKE